MNVSPFRALVPLVAAVARIIRRRHLALSTRTLLREVTLGEVAALVAPIVARLRPIAGTKSWFARDRAVARAGGRRWFVAGTVGQSIEAMRTAHGVEIARSLDAVPGAPPNDWYVSWKDADGECMTYVDSGTPAGVEASLHAADRWDLWRCYELAPGDVTGQQTAVTVRLDADGTKRARRRRVVAHRAAPAIDAVYTWVDDSDPAWRAARDGFRLSMGATAGGDDARFANHDELRYSLRTLWMYGDWMRRIHVVTAGHAPPWLVEDERLRIVRHGEFCPAAGLPTFNSHAIESRLHHIVGLAEHFIYLNDDIFLRRAVEPTTFFELGEPTRPRVFLDEAVVPGDEHLPPGMFRASQRTTQIVETLTGQHDDHLVMHAAYPCRRSLLVELEHLMPEEFAAVAHRRFRHRGDISVPASLAPHYWLATGQAVAGHSPVEYVSLGHVLTSLRLRRLTRSNRFDMYCLNSTDASGVAGVDRRTLTGWMRRLAPVPSPWERR